MGGSSTAGKANSAAGKLMIAVLKVSGWLNSQLSSIMQLKVLCMDYHVCTSTLPKTDYRNYGITKKIHSTIDRAQKHRFVAFIRVVLLIKTA